MISDPDPLAIYVHWPYCTRICPYCDFNVYKAKRDEGLLGSILKDLEHWRNWSGPRTITSLHFGGGTPSLMKADDVKAIIEHVKSLWSVADDIEIAMEANPNDAGLEHWGALKHVGVNRLSLGVQTFHDAALKFLGRDHSAQDARDAITQAVQTFPSVSLDLIFGWSEQTERQWQDDLDIAITSGVSHISAYQLTIESGTAFDKAEQRGQARAVSEDQSADFYSMTCEALKSAGFEHYEVSNFAKSGARSRHNLTYWQGRDYVGAGPGAHGRLTKNGTRFATIAAMRPDDYRTRVQETGNGIEDTETLTPEHWADEYILMGLRVAEGVSLKRFKRISGYELPPTRLQPFIQGGYLIQNYDQLLATHNGRLVLNHITEKLLAG